MATDTVASIVNDLLDNVDFEESDSVTKAKAFITAAKKWLILSPQAASDQASSLTFNTPQIENMMNRAIAFVRAKDTSNPGQSVRHLHIADGFR